MSLCVLGVCVGVCVPMVHRCPCQKWRGNDVVCQVLVCIVLGIDVLVVGFVCVWFAPLEVCSSLHCSSPPLGVECTLGVAPPLDMVPSC